MITDKINIAPYTIAYQPKIDALMQGIAREFAEPISLAAPHKTPNATAFPDLYLLAIYNDEVIGTISLTKLKERNAVLRKMFLNKGFRSKGIAKILLNEVVHWAIENNITAIYLGTMAQFVAAQNFYEKNGFEKIPFNNLPGDFPINPVDAIFYKMKLA